MALKRNPTAVVGQPLVEGLLRGLSILRCFDHGRERLGSSELARMTGLPQPTVWRLCKTLEHGGYLVADPDGARYRPGLSILTLGYSALDTLELAELARPLLMDVAARFQGAASLSTREGVSMLYLQRAEAPQSYLSINLRVGSEVPIITTGTGWGYLAGLGDGAREEVLAQCQSANPDLFKANEKHMLSALASHMKTGYVTNIDRFVPGMGTVSVPLGTPTKESPYVLNITSASAVFKTLESRTQAGEALLKIAAQLRPVAERLLIG